MYAPNKDQLAACLDGLEHHLERLKQVDLSSRDGHSQALAESRTLLGTLAMYRGLLQRMEELAHWRQAA